MPASKTQDETVTQSYTTMSYGDVEAIGSHCQMTFCHQLDFLPFKCESCKGTYCLNHRTETAHACINEGAWARTRQQQVLSSTPATPKPTILNHESQCSSPSCKTLINTPLVPGIECADCNRSYCLKHRMREAHDCANLPRIGAKKGDGGLANALSILRGWGGAAKPPPAAASKPTRPTAATSTSTSTRRPPSASLLSSPLERIISPYRTASPTATRTRTAAITALTALKRTAKGDPKILADKRVYLHMEAVAAGEGHVSPRVPRADAYYSGEWSVGRVLDAAAATLGVRNENNRGGGEAEMLRVFHVEGGRLLEFGEKLGASGVKSGETLVLLRGVGPVDKEP